jgi:mannose-6-phosphate isomerase-like protein (cupin superfamily)
VSVSIPAGTRFQFRSTGGGGPLVAIAVTMPPWPGDGEAARTEGPWVPTVAAGPGLGEGRGG